MANFTAQAPAWLPSKHHAGLTRAIDAIDARILSASAPAPAATAAATAMGGRRPSKQAAFLNFVLLCQKPAPPSTAKPAGSGRPSPPMSSSWSAPPSAPVSTGQNRQARRSKLGRADGDGDGDDAEDGTATDGPPAPPKKWDGWSFKRQGRMSEQLSLAEGLAVAAHTEVLDGSGSEDGDSDAHDEDHAAGSAMYDVPATHPAGAAAANGDDGGGGNDDDDDDDEDEDEDDIFAMDGVFDVGSVGCGGGSGAQRCSATALATLCEQHSLLATSSLLKHMGLHSVAVLA